MTASKIGLSVATVLMLGAIPTRAWAEEQRDPFEAMQNAKKLLRGAMLTEAQVAQIRESRKAQLEQAKALQAKEKAVWDEFDDKYAGTGTIDIAELTALARQGQQLRAQDQDEKLMVMFQMRSLLTADQLRRVSETHQKMKNLNAQLQAFEPAVAAESAK